jgi:aryl-alcohol dehydrogenase
MNIVAGVIHEKAHSVTIEHVTLDACRSDEVIVEIWAVGICHTDIAVRDGFLPDFRWPAVLGHEGAGRVVHVGSEVTDVVSGDHVVLSFASCGDCGPCRHGAPVDCERFYAENIGGCRHDGSLTHKGESGPIYGSFFGQSSFATHSVVRARNVVKVAKDLPLELLGPLGCGLQTGAGTVLNFIKPPPGSSIAIFGAGAVGMAAAMAAKVADCRSIIVLDLVPERLALALELGATHVIDVRQEDPAAAIRTIVPNGADAIIETSGSGAAMEVAMLSLAQNGVLVPVAMTAPGSTITVPLSAFKTGRIESVTEGAAVPREFIPRLIELYRAGKFPVERLVKFYDFEDINTAIEDADSGRVIKPVLLVADLARRALPATSCC